MRRSWVVGKATSRRTAKPCKIKTKYHMLVWLSCVESLNFVELAHIVCAGRQFESDY